jgi:hypothetical protein
MEAWEMSQQAGLLSIQEGMTVLCATPMHAMRSRLMVVLLRAGGLFPVSAHAPMSITLPYGDCALNQREASGGHVPPG